MDVLNTIFYRIVVDVRDTNLNLIYLQYFVYWLFGFGCLALCSQNGEYVTDIMDVSLCTQIYCHDYRYQGIM